jgi:hypothetical protein
VLEILNEIQSVGSTSAANGKSASNGPTKPSGLGLLSTGNEGTPKSTSKISTPTLPSTNSKRGKTSEKLTNAPTPQLGSYDTLSPHIQRKKLAKHTDSTSSLSKHSPPKGEGKLVCKYLELDFVYSCCELFIATFCRILVCCGHF